MQDAFEIFKASTLYSNLLDSFSTNCKLNVQSCNEPVISEAIYFHICKMKYAGWRHRINFKRHRKHSFSDFFQDIIAFYLKAALPSNYTIELEKKKRNTHPDIAIKRDDKFIFLIELKTTIGWGRPDETAAEPYKIIRDRINELSMNFNIPAANIIYIFEEHSNVSKDFSNMFWDENIQQANPRPTEFPYSVIFPLFNATDPYYWTHENGLKRGIEYREILDNEIKEKAKVNIVSPFEKILKQITDCEVSKNR